MQPEDMTRLQEFVNTSKGKGAADEFLAALLTRRGWPAGDVYAALGQYWESATGLAIPERAGAAESARDAFLYLLSFSTLATWTGALGSMLFQYINYWLPDAVSRGNAYDLRSAVTFQMACIAVAFPIYLVVMRLILREAAHHPEKLESGVRKWLTYIALLGTAGAMICDLIWFLDYFLTGELTLRFVLKAATVMAISGSVFGYYIGSLRWNRAANLERARARSGIFAAAATLAVIAAFSIGMGVAGTPAKQRQIEADRKRVEDLRNLGFAIKQWHDENRSSTIPAAVVDLRRASGAAPRLTDPETGAQYEYHPKVGTSYELCANFSFEDDSTGRTQWTYPSAFWRHGKGRACFVLDASNAVPN
jgi:hypothetical protein